MRWSGPVSAPTGVSLRSPVRPRAAYCEQVAHDHAAHSHAVDADADGVKLAIALGLIAGFTIVEACMALVAHSLALLSDAGHMLIDAAALGFSLVAVRLASRPAKGSMTFGLKRVEILSAQAGGVTLLVLAVFIVYEAIRRLFDPPNVRGGLILLVALLGVLVNLAAAWTLAKANRRSLNVEGSFQHILTDLYGFLGTGIAAGVILITGFQRADPIASLVVAGLMVRSGALLVKASARVFLEAAPEGLSPRTIGEALVGQPCVMEVHDLHVWEVTSGFPALSAHVLVEADSDCHLARRDMEKMLHARFGLDHTTLQVDHVGRDLIEIEMPSSVRA
jgi:cobalt-zinc-cadmium efflux system protein